MVHGLVEDSLATGGSLRAALFWWVVPPTLVLVLVLVLIPVLQCCLPALQRRGGNGGHLLCWVPESSCVQGVVGCGGARASGGRKAGWEVKSRHTCRARQLGMR